jgi:glycosyltransferase involved in cell wall biosynthesis
VRGQVAALGLADRVWLAGTRADVPALLRAADGFVLASRAEGTSCAVQEALASGLPVLATDVGANRRLLGDGRFGRLVPAADTAAMAAAMADFATAPAAGAAERARTAEWARGEFALERTLAAYDRLFSAEH